MSQSSYNCKFDDKYVEVVFPQGQTKFHNVWLRDHCQCEEHFHPVTKQRLQNTFDIPESLRPAATRIAPDNKGIELEWANDGHVSVYSFEWLTRHSYNPPIAPQEDKGTGSSESKLRRILWNHGLLEHDATFEIDNMPAVDYNAVMQSDAGVAEWTRKIYEYGFCFVYNTPATGPDTEKLITRIAHIRHTHYGGFWEFTADLAKHDTAYTNMFLACHTDGTYFTEPPGLQLLHLLFHEGSGGESLLVDGFEAARLLKEVDPKAYETLSHIGIPAHAAGEEAVCITPSKPFPVLNHDCNGNLIQIRWNNDDRSVMDKWESPDQVDEFYRSIRVWRRILDQEQIQFQLQPGTCLMFDNWRVLHGRNEFVGRRSMCGAYISRDDFNSRARLLNLGREAVLSEL